MPASNTSANYLMLLLALVGVYFGVALLPAYWDDVELKQAARVWISGSRFADERNYEKLQREFRNNAASVGLKLVDTACVYTRVDDDMGSVACDYVREVKFPLVEYTRVVRYRWRVNQKFDRRR